MSLTTDLETQLIEHEGMRLDMYDDSVGIKTIGVGRNLEAVGLRSEAEARFLLRSDILAVQTELRRELGSWIEDLNEVRQRVLLDMAFNLGTAGLMRFERTLAAVASRQYSSGAVEMLDSRWATQVGQRAHRLSKMMQTGED
jgi:lysozyme